MSRRSSRSSAKAPEEDKTKDQRSESVSTRRVKTPVKDVEV